jgi:hypothetical protein
MFNGFVNLLKGIEVWLSNLFSVLADLSKDFVIETISLVGRTDTVIFSNN